MKKITVSILTTLLMLSMVFSSSVFAANEEVSAWDSFLGLLGINASETTDVVGVEYRGHIQNKGDYPLDPATWVQGPNRLGTVGEALRLEGFWIQLTDKPADVNIKYQVHVQNEGWMEPVLNGKFAGTEGKSQRIEAIKIWLVDDAGEPVTGYSVEYRGHVENVGDVPQTAGDWYADGAQLGTVGASQRLEALEVKIVKTKADMTAYDAAVVAAAELTEDDYTAESWEVLTDALAVEVTADNTQAEVDAATAAIEIATGALVFANQADLDAAKLAVADLVEADYTAESWAAIAPALELPETTNAEVGAKALALGTAYADLVFAGQADLDAVVAEAATKTEADYTPATWAALAEALELPETTNAEVVAKTAAITEAIAGLVEVADMTAYEAIVEKAGEVVEADYTAATYAALQTALEENVVTNLDTQEDVDAATAAITAAYDALIKILKVESVSANNLKEVVVTFNGKVDSATATTASNYTMSGNSFTATLAADGKTVTLFATNTLTNNAEKTLVVKGVKDEVKDQTLADTTKKFTPSDVVIPTVEKVESLSNKTFKVTFSEPINTVPVATSYRIGGAVSGGGGTYGVFTVAAIASTNSKVFTVTTTNPVPEGSIDVEVNIAGTINDFAGYVVPTVKKSVTVTTDTTAPQALSATVLSQTEVQVTFNKEVSEASVTAVATGFGWGTTSTSATKTSATATKIDATNYKVTFTGANAMTVGERFFFVPTAITDLGGNIVAAKSFPITVVADAAPSVTSVTVPSANVIQINFNKSMDQTSVQSKSNYVLKDSLGGTVNLTSAALSYDATNKLVLLTGLTLTDSSYTLTMTNIKDNVLNTMTATTKTFTNVPSAGPIAVNQARFLDEADGTGKDVLILPFNMSMATSGTYSSLNAAKWTLNGAPLPAVATLNINPNDDKEVVIHLNGNYTTGQNLTVNNIASAYGAIQTSLQTFTGPGSAQTGLALATGSTSIKLLDTKTFELKVNRKLSSVDPSEFAIWQAGTTDITTTATPANAINPVASATFANTTTGSTITITMTNALNTTVNYQVGTKNVSILGTKDLDGIALAQDSKYATNATIAIAASITGAYVLDNTNVVVKLDQPVGMTSKFDFVVKYDGVTQAITSATGSANTITLVVPAGASTAGTVTLATVGQASIQTESVSGLKITALADVKTADMFRVQAVALGNNDGTLAVDDTVTVTFTEAVDPLTLGFVAGDKQGDDTYTKSVLDSIHTAAGTAATTDAALILRNVDESADLITLNIANLAGGTYFSASVANIDSQITLSADGKTLTYKITGQAGGAVTTTTDATKYGNVQSITVDTATIGSTTQNIINTFMTNVLTSTKF